VFFSMRTLLSLIFLTTAMSTATMYHVKEDGVFYPDGPEQACPGTPIAALTQVVATGRASTGSYLHVQGQTDNAILGFIAESNLVLETAA